MRYLVIKCGGSVFEKLPKSFYQNIIHLKKSSEWVPIIVHGGGPLITSMLELLEINTSFVNGLRVTDNQVLDVVEMVLSGSVNKKVVGNIVKEGGEAFGLSGVDGFLLKAKPLEDSSLGFVGEVVDVNDQMIQTIVRQGYIPVISPIGVDQNGQRYNINGDTAASAIAKALEAKLCFISDIPGILVEENGEKIKLNKVTKLELEELINRQIIWGGMLPKVKAAIDGLVCGVPEVTILNGLENNSLIEYCAGFEVGTKIVLE